MKGTLLLLAALGATFAGVFAILSARVPSTKIPVRQEQPVRESVVVGPGRVEPVTEFVRVGSEVEGRLTEVPFEEGARVNRGQSLAIIASADYEARVASAEAEVATREAELRRILSGARTEERREAQAAVHEAEAALANAGAQLRRYQALYAERLTAHEELQARETSLAEAESRLEAARQHRAFVEADARAEDRERAQAQLASARARLAEARSLLEKTVIRAPITGVVLRRHYRAGEIVRAGDSIVTIGDISRLRVRMEVDERDVGRMRIGQPAYCSASAFPDRKFAGTVTDIGRMLGRKNIHTDDPAERADSKVLEVLIELEQGITLPPGLRVDVFVTALAPAQ